MLHSKSIKFKPHYLALFILILSNLFNTSVRSQELPPSRDEIGISITPPLIKKELDDGEILFQEFKINFVNIKNPKLTFNYFETDVKQKKKTESTLLKEIIKINAKKESDTIILDTQFDTVNLKDKTYFFLLEVLLQTEGESESIHSNLGVGIPIMLTVNKTKESKNPKPDIVIKPRKSIYFAMNNESVQSQLINQSDKLIEFGGEILVLDDKNTILYSERISPEDSLLSPKQAYQKFTQIPELPKKGIFPYYGKVSFAIRGAINSERHIETKRVSVWILPYQLILAVIGSIVLTLSCIYIILRKIHKRRLIHINKGN
jgi:hypothetical protein